MRMIIQLPPRIRRATFTSFLTVHKHLSRPFSSTSTRMAFLQGRSYADALALLEGLQSNRAVASSISNSSRDMNLDAIPEMLEWTSKAGYNVSDFAKHGLKCIHVAGTKGKGSVCAMVENILMQYRDTNDGIPGVGDNRELGKIGLYTSPHLVTVRERIRIDGAPISESMFAHYFFELWDRFSTAATSNASNLSQPTVDLPGYFRYLTLLAFHTFVSEGIQTAIVECGIGGEYDSTNILPPDAVTVSVVSKLGIDHVGMLGDTIEKIARHKAGIIKQGVPAFTAEQVPEAQAILQNFAVDKGAELRVVRRLPQFNEGKFRLSLEGDFQKDNASLAVEVAVSHLRSIGISNCVPIEASIQSGELPPRFVKGLENTKWPGRCEVRKDGNIEWLIDGAHTVDSLEATAYWYLSKIKDTLYQEQLPTATMLIFNQQDRDAQSLIRSFLGVLANSNPKLELSLYSAEQRLQRRQFFASKKVFTYGAFCTNIPFKSDVPSDIDLRLQEQIAKTYQNIVSNSLNVSYGSVEEAVELARKVSQGDEKVLVLVTGSLHLVGALMQVLERDSTGPS